MKKLLGIVVLGLLLSGCVSNSSYKGKYKCTDFDHLTLKTERPNEYVILLINKNKISYESFPKNLTLYSKKITSKKKLFEYKKEYLFNYEDEIHLEVEDQEITMYFHYAKDINKINPYYGDRNYTHRLYFYTGGFGNAEYIGLEELQMTCNKFN